MLADAGEAISLPSGAGETPMTRPMTPIPYRVVGRREETLDVTTLELSPVRDAPMAFLPGQFNMLTAFGIGEAAISVSSPPRGGGPLEHTVRDVGPVTHSLCCSKIGDLIGVRGPFGTDWGIGDLTADWAGRDVVVVAGGIGLAPLRGAVHELIDLRREQGGRVFVVVGARDPSQIIFREDLVEWSGAGAEVSVTVDASAPGWTGQVGLVTSLLGNAGFDPATTAALVCGPEIMMRFTASADRPGCRSGEHPSIHGAQHAMRRRMVRPLSARTLHRVP